MVKLNAKIAQLEMEIPVIEARAEADYQASFKTLLDGEMHDIVRVLCDLHYSFPSACIGRYGYHERAH
jgi:hypothetical protein